jgi:D-alanyl-D-alanine carboxypeptidase
LISVLCFFIVLGSITYVVFREDPEYVVNFLEKNPETTSLYVTKNSEDIIKYQIEDQRPLASTLKIVIAIEYAYQVAEGKLDEEEQIPLTELDRFYLEGTDGGAQPAWLGAMKEAGLIQDEKISLHQVVKGMITYSSNANTEYLMDRLGLENINERIMTLGLENHEPIYPFSSALLISYYTDNKTVDQLKALSDEDYRRAALDIHNDLKSGNSYLKEKASNLSLKLQKVWSDRMTRATAADYQKLMAIINQGNTLSSNVQNVIRSLMEWPMEIHTSNGEKFLHFGAKGGSTAYVLNQAMYVEDRLNNKMELILFTDNLSLWQSLKLNQNIDFFLIRVIDDPDYLESVRAKLE